jgi:hypothetical protein
MIDGLRAALGRWRPHAIAGALLASMAVLMFTSIRDDVVTVDEPAHLAGYTYLTRADFRLNRQHPPLMKDLASVPLLFMRLHVPADDPSWDQRSAPNFGRLLLYHSGRSPEQVTRAARIPMMLFTLGLGWGIYWWTAHTFCTTSALLALFFYALSPTFLAHGRLVNTDVGAAAGLLLGTVAYLRFIYRPSMRNLLLAGLVIGLAFLAKFSTYLLMPAVMILTVAWTVGQLADRRAKSMLRRLLAAVCVLAIAHVVVYLVYLHHTWNFPRSASDAYQSSAPTTALGALTASMLDTRLLRPWGYYLLGLQDVIGRIHVRHGHSFFLGSTVDSGRANPLYFPVLYLVKEPLALHVLTLVVLLFAPWRPRRPVLRGEWPRGHFAVFALVIVWALYWTVAIVSPLQIGVRHVLPTFPLTYILVGAGIGAVAATLRNRRAGRVFWTGVAMLLVWQATTVLRVHPSYVAYFNEIAGGPDGGAEWASDSNLDWGQDLRRLVKFMNTHRIEGILLDYFGGADVDEYLRNRWHHIDACDQPQPHGWVAVSAFRYAASRRVPECDYRRWLMKDRLVTKIGYSIFVFHFD